LNSLSYPGAIFNEKEKNQKGEKENRKGNNQVDEYIEPSFFYGNLHLNENILYTSRFTHQGREDGKDENRRENDCKIKKLNRDGEEGHQHRSRHRYLGNHREARFYQNDEGYHDGGNKGDTGNIMDLFKGCLHGVSGNFYCTIRDRDDSVNPGIAEKQGYKGKEKAEILKEEKEIAFSWYRKAEKHKKTKEDKSNAKEQPGKHKALTEIFYHKSFSAAEG